MTKKIIKDGDMPHDYDEKIQTELTTSLVKDYIGSIDGKFTTKDLYFDLGITDPKDKSNARVYLKRLWDDGTIERWRGEAGTWRKAEKKLEKMDLTNVDYTPVDIWLPLNIHGLVKILPGNIIVVTGDADAGKTAFLLNIARENLKRFKIHYFNSEMSPEEMRERLDKFDNFPFTHKNFSVYERLDDFEDVIIPGKENINIIDYLELVENYWEVAKYLKNIYRKLNGALAIVAIQKKNPKTDDPLGGKRALEKPRLVLSLSAGKLKILKAKNWINQKIPKTVVMKYKIIDGCKFTQINNKIE